MKHYLMAAVLALAATGVSAQTQQGAKVLSGSISLDGSENTPNADQNEQKNSTISLGFHPAFGFMVKDNLEVGAALMLNYNSYSQNSNRTRYYSAGLSPYLRKYWPVANQFYLTGTASVFASVGHNRLKAEELNDVTNLGNSYSFGANLAPGLAFFVTERLSLHGSLSLLSFSSTTRKTENEPVSTKYTSNAFSFSPLPSNISFGIRYYFNQK